MQKKNRYAIALEVWHEFEPLVIAGKEHDFRRFCWNRISKKNLPKPKSRKKFLKG